MRCKARQGSQGARQRCPVLSLVGNKLEYLGRCVDRIKFAFILFGGG